jgi:PPOX class probable F420-dependent enzyme
MAGGQATEVQLSPRARELLSQPIPAVVATVNVDGSPQLTVVWFEWRDGVMLFNTTEERIKGRNLRRDPRVALTIVDPLNQYRFVTMTGRVELARDWADEDIDRIARRYTGAGFNFRPGETRVSARLRPEKVLEYGFD